MHEVDELDRLAGDREEMSGSENLIPKHGGSRKLKSGQLAQLVHDITVRFCDRYIRRLIRTLDQMVQAARSGVQNIAEGSRASGTSGKTELEPMSVARASALKTTTARSRRRSSPRRAI